MAKLRKDDRREKVLSKINDIAKSRQQQEAKQKLQQTSKDVAPDGEVEAEAFRPLMTNHEANEDTADSVFLQPYCCVSTDSHSPSLSECQTKVQPGRGRSLSCHEGTRRKSSDGRMAGGQEVKTIRIQQIRSPNLCDHKSAISSVESRRSSINDFNFSTINGRERSSTVYEAHPHRMTKPKVACPSDSKIHKISETNQFTQGGEVQPSWPTSYHVLNEDAVL